MKTFQAGSARAKINFTNVTRKILLTSIGRTWDTNRKMMMMQKVQWQSLSQSQHAYDAFILQTLENFMFGPSRRNPNDQGRTHGTLES